MIILAASDPGVGALAFRLLGSLAVVVGLLLLIARFVNRRFTAPSGAPVQVMHRQQLGRGQGVAVISVGGRVLVVGTTEHQVTLLTELEPDPADDGIEVDPIVAGALGLDAPANHEAVDPDDGFEKELAAASAGVASSGVDRPGALAGSLLSPQTWRQTFAAISGQGGHPPPGRRAS
ncbi:flagellar biosynthetic protein FliO [Nocardioides caeni]|uniref:Flagellar protein n=1 Tax=Nocardioides caeni TaxID=574700 RepID=A0A4S8NDU1_9ACTN|nr:flagellar biosynthetic protein FliO [Nocardioides caeni]THV14717.1 hypothetical protein E9934_08680 [Nocardioides caeni]